MRIEAIKKMKKSKNNWFWNIIIFITVLLCIAAFLIHYKNWSKFEEGHFQVFSGVYKQRILLSDVDSISFVEKIPKMERKSGFSWLAREKGVFKDSLTDTKTYVFVDDLHQQKIRIVHHDSLKLFLNFTDSIQTKKTYEIIKAELSTDVE